MKLIYLKKMQQIVKKLFCLHKLKETKSVEIKNDKGETIELRVMFVCEVCGKVVTSRI